MTWRGMERPLHTKHFARARCHPRWATCRGFPFSIKRPDPRYSIFDLFTELDTPTYARLLGKR